MRRKVVGLVGSYRKGGTIDSAVEAILAGAREQGAETKTIYLREQHIEFCNNCRACTQQPGAERGKCLQEDDLESILTEIESAEAVVLGSPVNYYNLTALFRQFMERLLGYTYWPWGQAAPHTRNHMRPRKAILVASTAMPGFCIPLFTGASKALQIAAGSLGARTVGKMWIGLSSREQHPTLSARNRARARRLGMKLA
jgi:putative NADPH-quinone reductase